MKILLALAECKKIHAEKFWAEHDSIVVVLFAGSKCICTKSFHISAIVLAPWQWTFLIYARDADLGAFTAEICNVVIDL